KSRHEASTHTRGITRRVGVGRPGSPSARSEASSPPGHAQFGSTTIQLNTSQRRTASRTDRRPVRPTREYARPEPDHQSPYGKPSAPAPRAQYSGYSPRATSR